MSFNGGLARSYLALFLSATVAACGRDSTTEPVSPDAVLRLEAVSPITLEGTVGELVNSVPTVIVRNQAGRPVPGIEVTFIPLGWAGNPDHVANHIAITNSLGVATAGGWTLGTKVGLHRLEASILGAHLSQADSGAVRVVTFHAEAKAGAPAVLSIYSGHNQVGLPGDELDHPTVWVTDRHGNYSGGVAITFSVTSGGGLLTRGDDQDNRTWILGPHPGLNSVVASGAGLNSVTFHAQAVDLGATTSYDMNPQSVRLIASGSIALGENDDFRMVYVEGSDAFPGLWRTVAFGKYTLSGTKIVLTHSTGVIEQGTLVNDSLSVLRTKENWVGTPPQMWTFVKRK